MLSRLATCDRQSIPRRRGTVLVAVMVCLLVVTTLAAALVQSAIKAQQQTRLQQQQLQAFWIAESAARRAIAQLNRSGQYRGETWRIAADELGSRQGAVAVIRVEPIDDESGRQRITVEARYPDDPVHRAAHTKTWIVNLPESGEPS